jgi:hypothetical protein
MPGVDDARKARGRITQFTWSPMSPRDYAHFREVEFEGSPYSTEELNPSSSWVIYVEARDQSGRAVASQSIAFDSPSLDAPTDSAASSAAMLAALDLAARCEEEGYLLPRGLGLVRVPLRAEYRAP